VELNPGIFKAYDIRGIYGEELDEGTAYDIGRSFVRVLALLRDKQARELRIGLGRIRAETVTSGACVRGHLDAVVAQAPEVPTADPAAAHDITVHRKTPKRYRFALNAIPLPHRKLST